MSNSNVEYVLSKTLNDFIDEHETISYDIISELNKFDQYVADHKQAAFPSYLMTENSVNIKKFMSAIQNSKIVMDYADYTWNCKGLTMYNCKLCKDSVTTATLCKAFATIDDFLDHVQKLHTKNIEDVLKQQIADKKSEQFWAGELEKMKNTKYIRHCEEFLQEIDKILDVEDSNMNSIANSINNHKTNENDMKSKISCSSGKEITLSSLSTAPTNLTMNSCDETMEKKKKKRTSGQCDVCNRTFNDLYNLRIHKMIHTDERPFQCEECGKRFRQYNKLKNHCITHTNEKPHICDTCGKGFRFRNYLSVHKRLHSGENPYKCNFCEKYFHSLHAKRLHTKILHCETETFTCPICAKVLTAQCYLTAHIKRHTNQRDYKCEICNKCFFSQSQLKDHQLVHTNLKPYQCSVCGSRFQRKSNYTQHLKMHTGEKTYVCNICYKSFGQNAGLYGHMKSHTK